MGIKNLFLMPILMSYSNFLRLYRKRSSLTQADIAYLMGMPGYSNISRCENGQRAASIELLLVYHHLFEASIETFYRQHSETTAKKILPRLIQLTEGLKGEKKTPKNLSRIRFLERVITRLSSNQHAK